MSYIATVICFWAIFTIDIDKHGIVPVIVFATLAAETFWFAPASIRLIFVLLYWPCCIFRVFRR